MSGDQVRFEIAMARRILAREGCESAVAGHVSVRAPGEEAFYVTPFEYFDETTPDRIIKASFDLRILEGDCEASPAIAFHAGLDAETKRAAHGRFRSGEAVVVVATIAFGMGIDRPDVRFVVHLDMPDSPEAYYQQIGRAGRDGDPAETLLLYGGQDIAQARHWLAQSAAPESQKRVMRTKLEEMIALTEAATCRTRSLLACFGEDLPEPCGHCDNCAAPPRMESPVWGC